jgi:hypothetical protein
MSHKVTPRAWRHQPDIRRPRTSRTSPRTTRRAPAAGPAGSAASLPSAIIRATVAREHPSMRAASTCVIRSAGPLRASECPTPVRARSSNAACPVGARSSSRRMRHERPYFRAGRRPARSCARTDSGCICRTAAACSTVRSSGRSSRFSGALVTLGREPSKRRSSAVALLCETLYNDVPRWRDGDRVLSTLPTEET